MLRVLARAIVRATLAVRAIVRAFSVRVVRFVRQAPEFLASQSFNELVEAPQDVLILVVCSLRAQPLTINSPPPVPGFPRPQCQSSGSPQKCVNHF